MQRAILTGATGLVGSAVARHLSAKGVQLLCLGRKNLTAEDASALLGPGVRYLRLPMEEVATLRQRLDAASWDAGADCVFFNFAWRGQERLTDGSFAGQLANAVYAVAAIRSAKQVGCTKFVNAGTLEETHVELALQAAEKLPYQSQQTNYALAKLASRDMCKIVAYLEKIDYVHTRMSVPLVPDLTQGSYVASTLKKIVAGQPYEEPLNDRLSDIVSIDDVAEAYDLIGMRGKNKADYFIGSARPATLRQYFECCKQIVARRECTRLDAGLTDENACFSGEPLRRDTGFVAVRPFENIITTLRDR